MSFLRPIPYLLPTALLESHTNFLSSISPLFFPFSDSDIAFACCFSWNFLFSSILRIMTRFHFQNLLHSPRKLYTLSTIVIFVHLELLTIVGVPTNCMRKSCLSCHGKGKKFIERAGEKVDFDSLILGTSMIWRGCIEGWGLLASSSASTGIGSLQLSQWLYNLKH